MKKVVGTNLLGGSNTSAKFHSGDCDEVARVRRQLRGHPHSERAVLFGREGRNLPG